MTEIEAICRTVDEITEAYNASPALRCPDEQMKSRYLKCCNLVYINQKAQKSLSYKSDKEGQDTIDQNLKLFKEWLPILKAAKV